MSDLLTSPLATDTQTQQGDEAFLTSPTPEADVAPIQASPLADNPQGEAPVYTGIDYAEKEAKRRKEIDVMARIGPDLKGETPELKPYQKQANALIDTKSAMDMTVNWRGTAAFMGMDVSELETSRYGEYKATIAGALNRPVPKSEGEYRSMLTEYFTKEKNKDTALNELFGNVVLKAFQDTGMGKNRPLVGLPTEYVKEWETTHKDLISGDDGYHSQANSIYKQTLKDIESIRGKGAETFSALMDFTQGKADNERITQVADHLSSSTPEERQKVYRYIGVAAEAGHIDRAGIEQFAINMGQSFTRGFDFVPQGTLQQQENAFREMRDTLATGQVFLKSNSGTPTLNDIYRPSQGATGSAININLTGREATPEEVATLKAQAEGGLKTFGVIRELRNVAKSNIDPIRPVFENSAIERGAYGLAGSLGLMVPVAISPVIGTLAYQAQEYDRIMLENPNINPTFAQGLALFEGAGNAALDRLQLGAINGKLPVFGGLLSGIKNNGIRRVLTTIGVEVAEQNLQEGAQDLIAPLTETLTAALRQDMPDKDFGALMKDYIGGRAETFFAVLPLALLGGGIGTYRDLKNPAMQLADRNLEIAGFGPTQRDYIAKATTPEEKAARIEQEWGKRKERDIKAGEKILEASIAEARTPQGDTIEVNTKADGVDEWIVRDPAGKEVARVASEQEAVTIKADRGSAEIRSQANVVADLLDSDWRKDKLPNFEAQFGGEVTPEQLLKDAEAKGDTKLVEAIKASIEVHGNDPAELAKLRVLGESRITPYAEGQYKALIKLNEGYTAQDAFEELTHSIFDIDIAEGRLTKEQAREWVRQTTSAGVANYKFGNDAEVRESMAQIAQDYTRNKIDETNLPSSFVAFLKKLYTEFVEFMRRAKLLDKAFAGGKIDAEFERYLSEKIGLSDATMIEREVSRIEGERLYRGTTEGGEYYGFSGKFYSRNRKSAEQYGDITEDIAFPSDAKILTPDDDDFQSVLNQFEESNPDDAMFLNESPEIDGFMFPSEDWVNYLKNKGYDGTSIGKNAEDVFLFDKDNTSFSIRSRDEAYDAAVKAGDEAEQQRLVDEAAKEAGYGIRTYYHGTKEKFTKFLKEKIQGRFPYSFGFHFTDRDSEARIYATSVSRYADARENKSEPLLVDGENIISAKLKTNNPLVIETTQLTASMEADGNRYEIMAKLLEAQKAGNPYDSVIIKRERGDEYDGSNVIVFDPSQIKSADPITRDDAGNVIPLSQRFNSESNDIRFSIRENPDLQEKASALSDRDKERFFGSIEELGKINEVRGSADFWNAFFKDQKINPDDVAQVQKQLAEWKAFYAPKGKKGSAKKKAEPKSPIQDVLDRYDEGDESISTPGDVVNELDGLAGELDNQELEDAVREYRDARRDEMEMYGERGGSDDAAFESLIAIAQRIANEQITSFSIQSQDQIDRVNKAVADTTMFAEGRMALYEKAKMRFKGILAENKDILDALKEGGALPETIRRAKLLQGIAELEVILRQLPAEVRGKVGGFGVLARGGTGDTFLANFFRDRVRMIDEQLEKYLSKEYDEELYRIFERAKPKKDQPGERPKGIGADIQDLFAKVKEAQKWTTEEINAHMASIESRLDSEDLSAEQEARLTREADLIGLVGGWRYKDSNAKAHAVKTLKETYAKGYYNFIMQKLREKEQRQVDRDDAIAATGMDGVLAERQEADKKENGWKGKFKKGYFNLISFDQFVSVLFGEKSEIATRLADGERNANSQKEDATQSKMDEVADFFAGLAGKDKLKGEQLRWKMSQKSLKPFEGTRWSQLEFSETEAVAATMLWMQEDGRRHMEGKYDDGGKPISAWHYTQEFVDLLEANLSKEAKALRDFLLKKYDTEYDAINKVYKALNGINLPKIENYSPVTVAPINAPAGMAIDPITGGAMAARGTAPGALRSRGVAIAEPKFQDALQTYIAHTKQMEHWKAYAPFMADANGILRNRDVQNAIEAKGGKEAKAVLNTWTDLFSQGGVRSAEAQLGLSKDISALGGRAARVALVGRLGTIIIQSTQLGAALAEMPTGSYILRMSKLLSGNLGWKESFNSPYIQRRLNEMPPIVRQAVEGLRSDRPNIIKASVEKLGRLISGADALFTAGTYAITYDYHLTQAKSMGIPSPEKYAHNVAERAVDKLAQPTRMGARSVIENTSTGLIRNFWAFASESRKNLGLAAYAFNTKDPSRIGRTLVSLVILNSLVGNIIRNAWSDARDDDDDEWFDEKHWGLKRLIASTMVDAIQVRGIPVLGDAISSGFYDAVNQYHQSGSLVSFSGAIRAMKHLPKYVEGDADWEMTFKDVDGILSVGGLFNENIAAAASLSHLANDAFGVAKNAKKEVIGE